MATMNKVYNINSMRPLLKALYDGGNRKVSTSKMATDAGIDATDYQCYQSQLERLYDAVCNFIRVNRTVASTDADKTAAFNAIYPRWADLLHDAEASKDKRDLYASEHDVHSLIGFAERQMDSSVDDSIVYGGDKLIPHKAYGTETFRKFKKQVETDLGIKIAQIDAMPDHKVEYLRSKRKLVNKYRKANNKKKDLEDALNTFVGAAALTPSDELDKQIADIRLSIAARESQMNEIKAELDKLLADYQAKQAAQTSTPNADSKPVEQTAASEPTSK